MRVCDGRIFQLVITGEIGYNDDIHRYCTICAAIVAIAVQAVQVSQTKGLESFEAI
jgi:hypothetical protein